MDNGPYEVSVFSMGLESLVPSSYMLQVLQERGS